MSSAVFVAAFIYTV